MSRRTVRGKVGARAPVRTHWRLTAINPPRHPELARGGDRIEGRGPPAGSLVARPMHQPTMDAAERRGGRRQAAGRQRWRRDWSTSRRRPNPLLRAMATWDWSDGRGSSPLELWPRAARMAPPQLSLFCQTTIRDWNYCIITPLIERPIRKTPRSPRQALLISRRRHRRWSRRRSHSCRRRIAVRRLTLNTQVLLTLPAKEHGAKHFQLIITTWSMGGLAMTICMAAPETTCSTTKRAQILPTVATVTID